VARPVGVALRAARVQRRGLASDALAPLSPEPDSKVTTPSEGPKQNSETLQAFTGTPAAMLDSRVVKIFRPPPGVQNATQNTLVWKMQWEDDQTKRWANPLMGWTSVSDPLSNTHMTLEFSSEAEAVKFAQRNGWKYEVTPFLSTNLQISYKGPRKYADNFQWKGPKGPPPTKLGPKPNAHKAYRDFPELYEPPPPPPKN